MADESSKDSASKEELSVCARWLHDRKVVEHFLVIIHVRETTAKSISDHLIAFLKSLNISLTKLRGLGFDGASNVSGHRSGVQRRLKLHSPSAIYIHCYTHRLQLAAISAAEEHRQVKRVLGTLLTI